MASAKEILISNVPAHIISSSVWLSVFIGIFLISLLTMVAPKYVEFSHRRAQQIMVAGRLILNIVRKPILLLIGVYLLSLGLNIFYLYFPDATYPWLVELHQTIHRLVEFMAFFWMTLNTINVIRDQLLNWALKSHSRVFYILIPYFTNTIKAILFLVMSDYVIPEITLNGSIGLFFDKLSKIFIIVVLGWLFYQIINVLEELIKNQFVIDPEINLNGRKINTQIKLLKRIILAIGVVVVVASILMVFDSVKNVGTGLLTTAGLISAVGAFASQQTLSRVFAGLQIAFTQPIRIGDTVIVEKEFGQIEEMTLSYIVIKIWDLRRLILPTDYFTSNGIQNLTRDSTQLIGTIFIYTDYTLPVAIVREKCREFVHASTLWDGKVFALQVTEAKEFTLELRILVSAAGASVLWDLRCIIREQMIDFLAKSYPECLVKRRNITEYANSKPKAVEEMS